MHSLPLQVLHYDNRNHDVVVPAVLNASSQWSEHSQSSILDDSEEDFDELVNDNPRVRKLLSHFLKLLLLLKSNVFNYSSIDNRIILRYVIVKAYLGIISN